MENLKIQDWHSRVYHKPRSITPKMWSAYRNWVLRRDGYTCKMCGEKQQLSVHHIVPREENGKNTEDNLITLCNRCHNIAELEQLSKEQILRYYIKEEDVERKPIPTKLDWHKWVYGGYQRPQSNLEKSTTF